MQKQRRLQYVCETPTLDVTQTEEDTRIQRRPGKDLRRWQELAKWTPCRVDVHFIHTVHPLSDGQMAKDKTLLHSW